MPPAPSGAWFNQVAKFLGPAYLRNAFTKRSIETEALQNGQSVSCMDQRCFGFTV